MSAACAAAARMTDEQDPAGFFTLLTDPYHLNLNLNLTLHPAYDPACLPTKQPINIHSGYHHILLIRSLVHLLVAEWYESRSNPIIQKLFDIPTRQQQQKLCGVPQPERVLSSEDGSTNFVVA